jgi:hypothetical protein
MDCLFARANLKLSTLVELRTQLSLLDGSSQLGFLQRMNLRIDVFCLMECQNTLHCSSLVFRRCQVVNKSTVFSLPLDISQNWLLQRTHTDTETEKLNKVV